MGFLDLFKRKNQQSETNTSEVPKDLFVEEVNNNDSESKNNGALISSTSKKGIDRLYDYLQSNFEDSGYRDALSNADNSYMEDNIKLLKYDLELIIQQVSTYYEDNIKEVTFHIETRERAGLVDVVEELKTKKSILQDHLSIVDKTKQDLDDVKGTPHRVFLSYKRGFMRGLAAISHHKIINRAD